MLKSRAVTYDDLEELKKLHENYYSHLDFPDFMNLLCGFVIEDENKEIILAGGVEAIGEAVLVTNKAQSRLKIGRALVEAQGISLYICQRFGIRELLAFTDNDEYARHLVMHGFDSRSRALSMKVPNGQG